LLSEIGLFALTLAFMTSIVQGTAPFWGAAKGNVRLMKLGSSAAYAQLTLVALAFGCLIWAFTQSDFSLRVVASNSYSAKPMFYKIAAAWGQHEGSMLLWALVLAAYGAAVAMFGNNLPATLKARALAVQGLIGAAFLAFIIFTSNPFARLDPAPLEGMGFNPLLQDPGLAAHPPFLYLGYVGFSIVFAFAGLSTITSEAPPPAVAATSASGDSISGDSMSGAAPVVGAAARRVVVFFVVVFFAAIVVVFSVSVLEPAVPEPAVPSARLARLGERSGE